MTDTKLYCAMGPDGKLVNMRPALSPDGALSEVPNYVREKNPASAGQMMVGVTPEAYCWRAHGGFGWSTSIAVEIAKLMGYITVEVKVEPVK